MASPRFLMHVPEQGISSMRDCGTPSASERALRRIMDDTRIEARRGAAQATTHVSPTADLFAVPNATDADFKRAYAAVINEGGLLYMIERPSAIFPFFVSIELLQPVAATAADREGIVRVAQRAMRRSFSPRHLEAVVLSTGPTPPREGLYKTSDRVHWRSVLVDTARALAMRKEIVAELTAEFGPRAATSNSWDAVVDASVYKSGERMLCSRKRTTDKCHAGGSGMPMVGIVGKLASDAFRADLYAPTMIVDSSGARDAAREASFLASENPTLEFIEATTIRAPFATLPTELDGSAC
jgi:hypothetical protein